jgi:hypothetical protein
MGRRESPRPAAVEGGSLSLGAGAAGPRRFAPRVGNGERFVAWRSATTERARLPLWFVYWCSNEPAQYKFLLPFPPLGADCPPWSMLF